MSEQEQQPVVWGVIGCGAIATHAVAPAILWSEWSDLYAIGSRNIARAEEKCREVKARQAYGSYEELLADDLIEAVYLGLPNGLHEEWVVKAAQAGKHILCEKSLALSTASTARMVDAARQNGVLLAEAYMYRHHPQWDIVRQTLAEHKIGDVRVVRAGLSGMLEDTLNHRWSANLGGGALYDVTCYGINLARFIFGQEPHSAVAMADTSTKEQVDHTSSAVLDFGYGRMAMVTGSLSLYNHQICEIEGTMGRITVSHPFIPGWEETQIIVEHGITRDVINVSGANHYLHMVDHFSMCVRDENRPVAPAENGLLQSLANEAVEQAWLAGRKVNVEELG